ncbi:MAG: imidazole glycerol phosphate synthase subunit HisH, partial [Clostridia bacterium]|nr:imidazole glycerol phosphate synthase subunit HisH [Clostridia bacterium]
MIAVIDYGVGNLFSLCSSLKSVGAYVVVSGDPDVIKKADKIILPGVGAFEDARQKLSVNGLDSLVIEKAKQGTPIMGICLGMQMLF